MDKKKYQTMSVREKRAAMQDAPPMQSIRKKCKAVALPRSSYYYRPRPETEKTLSVMAAIDVIYTKHPFYGSPKITATLRQRGIVVNHKRVERLMGRMHIRAITPHPRTSTPAPEHRIYPYLLREMVITHPNHVWSTDITFVRMHGGWMYLMAIIDWYSRYVIAWDVSNTIDTTFCCNVLARALKAAAPEIFNTDQGAVFTSRVFTSMLEARGIHVSMDGKGRALDNVFVERLWRSVKYEDIYLKEYPTVAALYDGLENYFRFFNYERIHQHLGYNTPATLYLGKQ